MRHVTSEEVLKIHESVLRRYGGCPNRVEPDKASSLIARVHNHEFYEGLSDVFALAAMYWVSMARGHIFTEGNKRTAVATSFLFLRRNGIRLRNCQSLEDIAVKVASGETASSELAEFLRANVVD